MEEIQNNKTGQHTIEMNSDMSSVAENRYKSRTGKQVRTNQSPTYNNTFKRYTNEFTDKFKIEPS